MSDSQTGESIEQKGHPQDSDIVEPSGGLRIGMELVEATRPFAREHTARSWRYVISTFALMVAVLVAAGLVHWWPLRLALSILGALVMVRAFITYHDYMHGAILRQSRIAPCM